MSDRATFLDDLAAAGVAIREPVKPPLTEIERLKTRMHQFGASVVMFGDHAERFAQATVQFRLRFDAEMDAAFRRFDQLSHSLTDHRPRPAS